MAQKLDATTADVLIAFQTIPGVDNATIINAGDGKIVDSNTAVSPQGNGYYGFKMDTDSSLEFEILNTKYTVSHHATAVEEKNDHKSPTIVSWKELGPSPSNKLNDNNWGKKDILAAIQRRLQLLGYYNAKVDGTNGKKTELAVLNFQADNKLQTDRIPGAGKTQPKLEDIVNKNKSGDLYIVRMPLIKFKRAPTKNPEDTSSNQPYSVAPEIDDRGFVKTKTMGLTINGPVVTMARRTKFRIKVIRENISDEAILEAVVSKGPDKVELITPSPLPNEKKMILELSAKDPGDAIIEIKLKQVSGSIVIGRLYVIVLSLITIDVQPYWVIIGGVSPGSPPKAGTKDDWLKAFDIVNNIWWPYGIYFNFRPFLEKNLAVPPMKTAGRLSNDAAGDPGMEFDQIINAPDKAGNPSPHNAINLLVVNDIEYSLGFSTCTALFPWPNGIAMYYDPSGNVATGHDLAHELGHCLSLSNLTAPNNLPYHPDEEPDEAHRKHDLWSFRKLMYAYTQIDTGARPGDGWIQNVGYGNLMPGGLISVRNLLGERADDECRKARDWTPPNHNPYYRP